MRRAGLLALTLAVAAWTAGAHDGARHAAPAGTAPQASGATPESDTATPFPVEIEMRFALVDQSGRAITEADFAGRPVALFFGYASCESICTVALPAMAEALDRLGERGAAIRPVMITVDPARDTPEAMRAALAKIDPRLTGLTGSEAALAEARRVFQVKTAAVSEDVAGAPVYAHGSFIYLIGPEGRVESVAPPILSPERLAELMTRYLLEG